MHPVSLNHSNKTASQAFIKHAYEAHQQLLARKDLGFLQLPERSELWLSAEQRAQEIREHFSCAVIVGIGGSSLGARALLQALEHQSNTFKLYFFENPDPVYFRSQMDSLGDIRKVHWVFISKSGSTMETLTLADFILQELGSERLNAQAFTVISNPAQNPLVEWAKALGACHLEIPTDVGGRFSVLSPVGLLPAALAGHSLEEIRQGALWALKEKELVQQLVVQVLSSFERREMTTLFWVYANPLQDWAAWLQQLWAESLAKLSTRDAEEAPPVSSPFVLLGANDQHSILQQLMEGTKDKWVWFFQVEDYSTHGVNLQRSHFGDKMPWVNRKMGEVLEAERSATYEALDQAGVSVLHVSIPTLSPYVMGAAFMLFQVLIGVLGEAININAYDQPGVEIGKGLAKKKLSCQ